MSDGYSPEPLVLDGVARLTVENVPYPIVSPRTHSIDATKTNEGEFQRLEGNLSLRVCERVVKKSFLFYRYELRSRVKVSFFVRIQDWRSIKYLKLLEDTEHVARDGQVVAYGATSS